MTLDVLVLCKDRPDHLTKAIACLDRQCVPYRGVLVDNSVGGPQARRLAESHGWTVLDGGDANYSESLNLAIGASDGERVMWLSDDAYLHDGALAALLAHDVPVVSPLILTSDGKVCFAGGKFWRGQPRHVGRGQDAQMWRLLPCQATEWVTTPAAVWQRPVLDAVGPLDVGFSWSHEDVDMCLRARALGFEPFMCMEAVVTHDEAQTKQMGPYGAANTQRFLSKWADRLVDA